MNYTELKVNIQDICENSFTDDQLAMFTEQAEQKIYNSVQIPALRKNVTGTLSNGNQYLGMPTDFLWSYSDDSFIVGPTPNAAYSMELHYGYYPQSIVTAGTTWLGDEFDSALLNGALIEAIRFMKGEPDIVANYEKMFVLSMGLLKNLGDGKLREDTYRSGQFRTPVS